IFGKFLIDKVTGHSKETYFDIRGERSKTGNNFILLSYSQSDWIITTGGKERVSENFNATIIHEFAHLWGNITGMKNKDLWFEIENKSEEIIKVSYDEIIAISAENRYRSEMGLNIRTYYSSTPDGYPVPKSRIPTDFKRKSSKKLIHTYFFNYLIQSYYDKILSIHQGGQ